MSESRYTLRRMTSEDVPVALRLSSNAGWNQLESDWRRVLEYQPEGCFVAESAGQLVGTVSSTCYGTSLAWIGMMLVDENHRRQGIGEALMRRVLDFLEQKEIAEVKLDATPLGEPLYRRLGFAAEWTFHRWRRSEVEGCAAPRPSDVLDDALLRVDGEAFGACRAKWLRRLANDSHVTALTCESRVAFGMLRPGRIADYLGPVTASDAVAARDTIEHLLAATRRPVFWDIPGPNEPATRLAGELGFEPVRDLTRMRIGRGQTSPDWKQLYALAGPAVG